jgi:hypothetical protein
MGVMASMMVAKKVDRRSAVPKDRPTPRVSDGLSVHRALIRVIRFSRPIASCRMSDQLHARRVQETGFDAVDVEETG